MRLVPRSLFARMVLVLLGGLIVAQLLSFAVHWRERGEFMTRAMGLRSAAGTIRGRGAHPTSITATANSNKRQAARTIGGAGRRGVGRQVRSEIL